MQKPTEEELLRRRNELEAELAQIKDTLNYIEKERREKQVAAVIEMIRKDRWIWDTRLVTNVEDIYEYDRDKYRVVLELVYDPLDDD